MGATRELRFLLAVTAIGLFTIAAYHALTLPESVSSTGAYRSVIIATMAFVWGMMVWLSYEEPLRFREIVMVTVVGLAVLAFLEIAVIMTGHASQGKAVSPIGPPAPLEDALWAEIGGIATLAFLLFYFRPQKDSLDTTKKED